MRLSRGKGASSSRDLLPSSPSSLHSLLNTQSSMHRDESLQSQSHRQGLARLTERAVVEVLFLAHLGRFEALRPLDRAMSWLFGCRSRPYANGVP